MTLAVMKGETARNVPVGQHVGQREASRGFDHQSDAPDHREDAERVTADRHLVQWSKADTFSGSVPAER